MVRFDVVDVEKDKEDKYELIGSFESTISELFGAPQQTTTNELLLKKKKNRGNITVKIDKVPSDAAWITIDLGKSKLKNTRGFFSATINPMVKFYKVKGGSDGAKN